MASFTCHDRYVEFNRAVKRKKRKMRTVNSHVLMTLQIVGQSYNFIKEPQMSLGFIIQTGMEREN